MAATSVLAYIQDNPTIVHAGQKEAKATLIRGYLLSLYDGIPAALDALFNGSTDYDNEILAQRMADLGYEAGASALYDSTCVYQIQRAEGGDVITIHANDNTAYDDVISINAWELEIVLPFRTNYKVRVSMDGATWTGWFYFKTRDTTYALPDAVNQPRVHPVTGITETSAGATIVNDNVGKSTVSYTSEGATVVNIDTGSNQTTSVTYTGAGATVVNKEDVFS